jgi:hypothetical protein
VEFQIAIGFALVVVALGFRLLHPMPGGLRFKYGDEAVEWTMNDIGFWIALIAGLGLLLWRLAGKVGHS